jgi:hypothetical protein
LPAIIVTGHVVPSLRDAVAAAGDLRLLEKPVDPGRLFEVLEELEPAIESAATVTSANDLALEERVALAARRLGASEDACARLALGAYAAWLCDAEAHCEVIDVGPQLQLDVVWSNGRGRPADPGAWVLQLLGGDQRIEREAWSIRCAKDGGARSDPVRTPRDAVDFRPRHRHELGVHESEPGGDGGFVNVPAWLRLLFELHGAPTACARRVPEPAAIPADLAGLWG